MYAGWAELTLHRSRHRQMQSLGSAFQDSSRSVIMLPIVVYPGACRYDIKLIGGTVLARLVDPETATYCTSVALCL